MTDSRADIRAAQEDSMDEGNVMSYRETADTDRETYRAWADRMVADVRELEAIADTVPDGAWALAPMWAEVRPGLASCDRCGHYLLATGRCIACEVSKILETVR